MNLQVGVKVLLKNTQGKYLFIKRTKQLEGETSTSWDIPGGRIEPNESLEEALRREAKEELGIELAGEPRLINAQNIFIRAQGLHVVRLTYVLEVDINIDTIELSDEHQEVAYMSLAEVTGVTEPYLAKTLQLLE